MNDFDQSLYNIFKKIYASIAEKRTMRYWQFEHAITNTNMFVELF